MEKSRVSEIHILRHQLDDAVDKLAEARSKDEILSVLKPLYINIRVLKNKLEELMKENDIDISSDN